MLTDAEVEALQTSKLTRDTPFVIQDVSHGYFSIARYYGGCTLNGASYTYMPDTDELVREDVLKFIAKLRKTKGKRKLKA